MENIDKLTYEEAMNKLELLVKELEDDSLSLDDSITKFERGMKLTNHCNNLLEKAEKKITMIVEGNDEKFHEEEFELPEE